MNNENTLNFSIKPLIVDRKSGRGTVEAWNPQQGKYVIMSLEFLEDLVEIIKSKKKFEGVIYKDED